MTSLELKGTLWKWTNYWNGWQPRWFILDKGILSYYKSEEEAGQGCKGAVNVSAADISAHPSDPYRLDVVIPGEQHFYLKAGSPHDRHQWLVALGTAKTCLNSEKASKDIVDGSSMRKKQCELRLYCDLLMQQVHSIKQVVTESPIPDIQRLDDSTALLGETCDAFIKTMEDCMRLSSPVGSSLGNQCILSGDALSGRRTSYSDNSLPKVHNNKVPGDFIIHPVAESAASEDDASRPLPASPLDLRQPSAAVFDEPIADAAPPTPTTTTFFSTMQYSFSTIVMEKNGAVATVPFLEACKMLVKIFDAMGSAAFAPVKMDLNGNIRKLYQKYDSDPDRYRTLQEIVENEVEKSVTNAPNSATDALLWLKRGILFLREFLFCFQEGEQDLSRCANIAYTKTLKRYHGWVVRGIFSIAVKAAPNRSDFVTALAASPELAEDPKFVGELTSDIAAYIAGIDRCLKSLHDLYEIHKLDLSETTE